MLIRSWNIRKDFDLHLHDLRGDAGDEDLRLHLSRDEVERLKNIQSPSRARTFLHSRSLLRRYVGRYLGLDPVAVEIRADADGKVTLSGQSPLTFSVSHSHERILIGLCPAGRPFGIDLEIVSNENDFDLISRHLFLDSEAQELEVLSGSRRLLRATEIWCAKEARFKMQGSSLPKRKEERIVLENLGDGYVMALCYLEALKL